MFYNISTLESNLMPNPVNIYIYIKYIICKQTFCK